MTNVIAHAVVFTLRLPQIWLRTQLIVSTRLPAPHFAEVSMGASCCKPEHEKTKTAMNDRGCTDVLCLLLFILVAIGTMVVGIVAMATGNIDQIKYPSDYNGRYCGKSGTDLSELPYAYYPQLDKDIVRPPRRRRAKPSRPTMLQIRPPLTCCC